ALVARRLRAYFVANVHVVYPATWDRPRGRVRGPLDGPTDEGCENFVSQHSVRSSGSPARRQVRKAQRQPSRVSRKFGINRASPAMRGRSRICLTTIGSLHTST